MKQTKSANTPTEGKNSTSKEAELLVFDVGSLLEGFHQIKDGRRARGVRYPLAQMLVLLLLGKLCGQDTPEALADWAKWHASELAEMLKPKHARTPHATTICRVLKHAIPVVALEQMLHRLLEDHPRVRQAEHLCLDGKQICGTSLTGEGNVYLLGLYAPDAGVMLYQVELAAGEGELTVAPNLLKAVNLRGKLVTGDAGFTQRNLSVQIVRQGGNYLWKVKRNQAQLCELIEQTFAIPEAARTARSYTQHSIGCGRIEQRTITVSSMLKGLVDWPHLSQVFKITCTSTNKKTAKKTITEHFGVTSLDAAVASPKRLLERTRGHWAIEAASHRRRDVTFHEDYCDLRRGNAAHIMAILNNLACAIIHLAGHKNAAAARRRFAANPILACNTIVQRL